MARLAPCANAGRQGMRCVADEDDSTPSPLDLRDLLGRPDEHVVLGVDCVEGGRHRSGQALARGTHGGDALATVDRQGVAARLHAEVDLPNPRGSSTTKRSSSAIIVCTSTSSSRTDVRQYIWPTGRGAPGRTAGPV